jgi:hypothetical protein
MHPTISNEKITAASYPWIRGMITTKEAAEFSLSFVKI